MVTALIIILMNILEAAGLNLDSKAKLSPVSTEISIMLEETMPTCFNFVNTRISKSSLK